MPPMRPHGGVKVEHPFRILKRIMGTIFKVHPISLIVVLVLIVLSSISGTLAISNIQTIVDSLASYFAEHGDFVGYSFDVVISSIIVMACFYLVMAISTYTYNRIMINVSQDTLKRLRDDLFAHMEKLPLKYFDSRTTGSVMSLYTNDVDTLRQMLSQSIPQLMSSIFTISSVLVMMLIYSPLLTLFTLLFTALLIFVTRLLTKVSGKYFIKQQKDLSSINGYIEEMIEGEKVIKVFNHEKKSIREFKELNQELEKSNFLANMFSGIVMPVANNIGYLSFAVSSVGGALIYLNSPLGIVLTIGQLSGYLLYAKNFANPISQISNQVNFILMALAGAKRIFDVMDEKEEVDEGDITLVYTSQEDGIIKESEKCIGQWAFKVPTENNQFSLVPLKGDVRFLNVDFGYDKDKIILHDISLYAHPGQKIAFVGATGAGKTTITNLINRFYDVQEGEIVYEGLPLNRIKKKDLRSSLGMVLQDTHLFSGTIAENIAYGKKDATREEVIKASELANASHFINLLPQGYDTYITGDGENLSQGQRQLLAIARAAIVNPPVLILDEATSSIDTWTESLIQKGMDSLMKGRTVFVIAHRLSTVRNSDAIMVLEHGRIIERGNHEELLKHKGKYYQLYTGAFELE